jgi:hypothetical protein
MDSLRATYSQILLVDNGGYFPETDVEQDKAWFLMDAMKLLNTDAVGVGERDLRFGLAFIRHHVKRSGLPVISSNLVDAKQNKLVFPPYLIKKVGTAKVGVFSLIGDKANLGPARDSLKVLDPNVTAKKMVAELKGKGATVIVLLSQLGKIESEDLVSSVEGISAVMAGKDVPILQKGRMIKNTVACYGGEQGQYFCRTELTLDAKRMPVTGEAETVLLGPEVGEKAEIAKLVKSFEDALNERMRKAEADRQAELAKNRPAAQSETDHFLGAEVCVRCHQAEGEQWKTTAHSIAWQTLVEAKKDATPECITCHVVGYRQSGGFQNSAATPALVNVQCENCHGMGTKHDAFAGHQVTEQVCITCHQGTNDPEWNFEKKLPMIAHGNMSGESIRSLQSKKGTMMHGSGTKGSN